MDLTKATDITIGGKSVSQLYLGGRLVWEKQPSLTWVSVEFVGMSSEIEPQDIWTDGTDVYYSHKFDNYSVHYIYNRDEKIWTTVNWGNLSSILAGKYVWTDGNNVYLSCYGRNWRLDKTTKQWSEVTFTGVTYVFGDTIWHMNGHTYLTYQGEHYLLNESDRSWSRKTWNVSNFGKADVWSDGVNSYIKTEESGYNYYRYNKQSDSFDAYEVKYADDVTMRALRPQYVWRHGERTFMSYTVIQLEYDIASDTWKKMEWNGLSNPMGDHVWTDGVDYYHSYGNTHYKLEGI